MFMKLTSMRGFPVTVNSDKINYYGNEGPDGNDCTIYLNGKKAKSMRPDTEEDI